jgi:hypothetical protein
MVVFQVKIADMKYLICRQLQFKVSEAYIRRGYGTLRAEGNRENQQDGGNRLGGRKQEHPNYNW